MVDLLHLFKTLAEIDSVSGEEYELSEFILAFLCNLGLQPDRDENDMIYCRIGSGKSPKLFCAHMDTVEPGRGIKVIEKDGNLTSNGTTILGADNKVSLAAILFSVKNLLTNTPDPWENLNLELLFSVREETDSGISQFNVNRLKSKVGFVFDIGGGTLDQVALSAPAITDLRIKIKGKSSHAASPEEGINALEILLKSNLKLGRLDDHSTFNLGLINGGSATNSIPEELILAGDLRSSKKELFEKHKENIENIFNITAELFTASVEVEWLPYSEGYHLSKISTNFKKLLRVYSNNSINLEEEKGEGASDAGFLNSAGIEAFCLSDGVIDSHTVNEKINIETFHKFQTVVEDLMLNF